MPRRHRHVSRLVSETFLARYLLNDSAVRLQGELGETRAVMLTMRTSSVLLLCAAVGILGCGVLTGNRDAGPFHITTDRSSYVFGSHVAVGVRNVSRATQLYNFCPVILQRFENGGWTTASSFPPAGGACAAVAYSLAAGDSVGFVFTLPQTPMMGSYRLLMLWLGDQSLPADERATPAFTISCPSC